VTPRLRAAGHAFLLLSAVAIAAVGITELASGGPLAQGAIRITLAGAILASQARSLRGKRSATDGRTLREN